MNLGDQPRPEIEPAEPAPGGADAVEDTPFREPPVVPDLSGIGNTAAKDEVPDELKQPEGADEGASNDGASEPEKEAQA